MGSEREYLKGTVAVEGRPGHGATPGRGTMERPSEAQRRFGGLVVAESRVFAGWISNDAIRVKGEIRLSNGSAAPISTWRDLIRMSSGISRRQDSSRGCWSVGIINSYEKAEHYSGRTPGKVQHVCFNRNGYV